MTNIIVIGERGAEPGLSAISRHKIGVEDGAITESEFQHAVDGRAASAGKMKKA